VSDEQSPDEAQSKRERQKARRAQRLEAERAAAAAARRKRMGAYLLVGLLLIGAVGYFVWQNIEERRAEQELIEAAQARLEELGCTTDEEMPPLGAGHFGEGELAANPPEGVYDHLPTTSGQHIASVVATGVYDEYVDERVTTHNLEHGYVVMWYDEGADPDDIAALKEFAQERIDDGDQEIVVAPYNQPLDDDKNFAFVAWERRQMCDRFDPGIALNFIREHMNNERAPEARVGPHLGGQPGELDPNEVDGPLVFPPLGQETPDEPLPDDEGGAETEDVEGTGTDAGTDTDTDTDTDS